MLKKIRNFSIIAHIDHGKSTLADRMLEITHTIEKHKMKEQVLDSMELERERGITIKMQPVRMKYKKDNEEYILNLIDTPGHIDFSYEVSRALKAVEGSLLLVDVTQGVQAQTLTTLTMAREFGLRIIPVLSKVDSPLAQTEETKEELAQLIGCDMDEVLLVSGKTGEGVEQLLCEVIKRIPAPTEEYKQTDGVRALVFDFAYSDHRGIIVFIRVFDGSLKKGDSLKFMQSQDTFTALEVGIFAPKEISTGELTAGSIGYIVTGIKKPGIVGVGDTIEKQKYLLPELAGYMKAQPVVWASIFPEDADDFTVLRQALERLRLSDSSLSFEEESSGTLGRGFRCGFLGMLHLEIITERLRREFNLELVVTTPSITYEVTYNNDKVQTIYSPSLFPEHGTTKSVREPWVDAKIITPSKYIGQIMQLLFEHEGIAQETDNFGENRTTLSFIMPLRELMRNFFDKLKSVSSGFASLSYELLDYREADVTRLDICIADKPVAAFARVVSRRRVEEEAQKTVEKLHGILPRQMFVTKIQGKAMGRIISSRTLSAFRKDVTAKLYGGDITRKKKLLEKQKKGKKKMKEQGRVNIPPDAFLKMMK
ncbi:translation elongation factor 4, partial [Patescibacteria group bacterium]|nr:translation elongation factor 4 [Patescibacteria group bacterium]MBU1519615.1 translation elongation factor 4 [Patescibacteria group bacterium]MBU2461237.1 translation elongation factor 4 [Patescibacteria group bacterium]